MENVLLLLLIGQGLLVLYYLFFMKKQTKRGNHEVRMEKEESPKS